MPCEGLRFLHLLQLLPFRKPKTGRNMVPGTQRPTLTQGATLRILGKPANSGQLPIGACLPSDPRPSGLLPGQANFGKLESPETSSRPGRQRRSRPGTKAGVAAVKGRAGPDPPKAESAAGGGAVRERPFSAAAEAPPRPAGRPAQIPAPSSGRREAPAPRLSPLRPPAGNKSPAAPQQPGSRPAGEEAPPPPARGGGGAGSPPPLPGSPSGSPGRAGRRQPGSREGFPRDPPAGEAPRPAEASPPGQGRPAGSPSGRAGLPSRRTCSPVRGTRESQRAVGVEEGLAERGEGRSGPPRSLRAASELHGRARSAAAPGKRRLPGSSRAPRCSPEDVSAAEGEGRRGGSAGAPTRHRPPQGPPLPRHCPLREDKGAKAVGLGRGVAERIAKRNRRRQNRVPPERSPRAQPDPPRSTEAGRPRSKRASRILPPSPPQAAPGGSGEGAAPAASLCASQERPEPKRWDLKRKRDFDGEKMLVSRATGLLRPGSPCPQPRGGGALGSNSSLDPPGAPRTATARAPPPPASQYSSRAAPQRRRWAGQGLPAAPWRAAPGGSRRPQRPREAPASWPLRRGRRGWGSPGVPKFSGGQRPLPPGFLDSGWQGAKEGGADLPKGPRGVGGEKKRGGGVCLGSRSRRSAAFSVSQPPQPSSSSWWRGRRARGREAERQSCCGRTSFLSPRVCEEKSPETPGAPSRLHAKLQPPRGSAGPLDAASLGSPGRRRALRARIATPEAATLAEASHPQPFRPQLPPFSRGRSAPGEGSAPAKQGPLSPPRPGFAEGRTGSPVMSTFRPPEPQSPACRGTRREGMLGLHRRIAPPPRLGGACPGGSSTPPRTAVVKERREGASGDGWESASFSAKNSRDAGGSCAPAPPSPPPVCISPLGEARLCGGIPPAAS
ncbi:collagen alpha-1(I) chain-like [Pantherophis guttatus]|uniref:Collagen alpha-1(I) chain-like n=1 Tax=Pantherophis guttatus TaxID=94885 RepID=A0ABM3YND7_PANGU|nr:collagen alpha-1(I) chain-like [Pantherophis guttatus]